MPELPEVETVRRGLLPRLKGRVLTAVQQRRPDLRLPLPSGFAGRLTGRRVIDIDRRAKYLLVRLDDGQALLVHLGMSGSMALQRTAEAMPLGPHDHVVLETDEGWQIRFNDPRRFGLMLLLDWDRAAEHRLLAGLGPEPLDDAFTGPVLAAALKGKRTSIKAALLDQRVVAGVGNIYACEALFAAGLSPRRSAHTVQGERADRLVAAVKAVLRRAIEDGGSSLRDHVRPDGELGYFQTRFAVYDRAGRPCPGCDCDKSIQRIVQAGRSTFFCPRRQR